VNIDTLVEHLTEPSTVRGISWTIGCVMSLIWISHDDMKGALEVLSICGLVSGLVGAVSRERKGCDAE
jgi:uncharacterized oligopeptide transporter (OPT) family protein